MSLHASVLMIKGDHLDRVADILVAFNYQLIGTVEHADNWLWALKAIQYPRPGKPRDIVHKAVFVHNGWTVILDPEMVMFANEDVCIQMSQALGSPIFGMVCEGTSNTYAYSFYDQELVRAFCLSNGEILDNRGDMLPEEEGLNLDNVFEGEVLEVMEKLGVNYLDFEDLQTFQIFELDESHISVHTVSDAKDQPLPPSPKDKKPWWKLW